MQINYSAAPTLKKFHLSEKFFRGIRGPIGSGKSVACVMEVISRSLEMPADEHGRRRSRWAIVRNTYPELLNTTLKTWQEWVPEEVCHIIKSPQITGTIDQRLPDGTQWMLEVIFLPLNSAQDTKKLLSLELTGIWFNEARELPLDIIVNGLSRLSRFPRKADVPSYWSGGIADTNSPDNFHWWYKRAVEHCPDNWEFFDQPGALLEDGEGHYIPNPAAENVKHHSKGFRYYLDMVNGADPAWIDVMILCKYKSLFTGKPVYAPAWNVNFHVAKGPLEVLPGKPLFLAFDFGLTPACVAAQLSDSGQMRVLREWVSEEMGLKQFLEYMVIPDLSTKFRGLRTIVTFDPAGVQRSQVDSMDSCAEELARQGLAGEPARTNDFEPRRRAVIDRLSFLSGGEPGYLVDPSCEVLIQGFNGGYQFEVIQKVGDGGQIKYKETPSKNIFSHIHDANQYLCLAVKPEATEKSMAMNNIMNRARMANLRKTGRSLLDA